MELPDEDRPLPHVSTPSPADGHPASDGPTEGRSNHAHTAPEGTAIARLAAITQLLLLACMGACIALIGVDMSGIAASTDFIDGDDAALARFEAYVQLSLIVSALSALPFIAVAVIWAIWQYRVAKQVSGQIRRSPGWHAGSWFIPVINLWYPYQNISDLRRAAGSRRPSWQIVWWLLWIASDFVALLSAIIYGLADYAETVRDAIWVGIAGNVLLLAAAPPAMLIVRRITKGVLHRPTSS